MSVGALKSEVVLTTVKAVVKSCATLKTTDWAGLVMADDHVLESAGEKVRECLQQVRANIHRTPFRELGSAAEGRGGLSQVLGFWVSCTPDILC